MGLALIGTWQPGMSVQVYGFPKPAIPVWRALTTNKKLLCNVNFRLVVQDAILNFKLTYRVWKKWPVCQIDWTIHVSVLQFYNQCTCLLHTHTHTCLAIQSPLHSSWWCCFYARVSTAVHHTVHIKVWEASLKKSTLAMRIKVPSWNVWLAEGRGRNQDR